MGTSVMANTVSRDNIEYNVSGVYDFRILFYIKIVSLKTKGWIFGHKLERCRPI